MEEAVLNTLKEMSKMKSTKSNLMLSQIRTRLTSQRLTRVYDALAQLGLDADWVEAAILANDAHLEQALGWICLHVPHDELPSGFSDKVIPLLCYIGFKLHVYFFPIR